MKLHFELDITPQEVLALFDGNVETLQRAFAEFLLKQMTQSPPADNAMAAFWQAMSERSGDMFKYYQAAMSGAQSGAQSGNKPGAAPNK